MARTSTHPRWTFSLLLLAAGCAHEEPNSSQNSANDSPQAAASTVRISLDDLSLDVPPVLRQLPDVAKVHRHGPTDRRTHRIVHVADWHFVEKDRFADDLRSGSDQSISDEEIDRLHRDHLAEVEKVQRQQLVVLRILVQKHGLRQIWIEGLIDRDLLIFDAKISALRTVGQRLVDLRRQRDELLDEGEPDEDVQKIIAGIEEVEQQYRRDLLQIGAAGQLLLDGEIDAVLPLEDADAYAAANPVGDDGAVTLDQEKIEAREDAQVRRLLDAGPFALIILGGAHDLAGNVERLTDGKAEYIRVELAAWKQLATEIE